MAGSNLTLTIGSTNYSFADATKVPIRVKPQTGEAQRQTGKVGRGDILDTPWNISNFTGLGIPKAYQLADDNRLFEGKNIDHWPGMWCLGPNGNVPTDIANTHQIVGFAEAIGNLFYFASTVESTSAESVAYFVGSTTTWTSATLVSDFNAVVVASGFPVIAMVSHTGATATAGTPGIGVEAAYALRKTEVESGGQMYQLAWSTDKTTWNIISHVTTAQTPSGVVNQTAYGLASLSGSLYCLYQPSNGSTISLRVSTNDGLYWGDATGGTLNSVSKPRSLFKWRNASGTEQIYVALQEGIYRYTGSTFVQEVDFRGNLSSNNGLFPQVWRMNGIDTELLVVPQGQKLWGFAWRDDGNLRPVDISVPIFQMPTFHQGRILALGQTSEFLWMAVGGEDASHTAGIFKMNRDGQWFGPLYDVGTANRQIRAMYGSSQDDNIRRLQFAVDNGTASDTNPMNLANIDSDPRYVTSYLHAATGELALPKNDRGLAELNGVWLKVEVLGTNISSTNKVTDVFAVADAAPIGTDGSKGTTLGEITASGGSINFAATPTGTGQSAKAMQVFIGLEGTSNASPYIEGVNIYVEKLTAIKLIHTFVIPLPDQGTVSARAVVLASIKSIVSATSYASVTYGEIAATIMKPYIEGGRALTYTDDLSMPGTVNAHSNVKFAAIEMVEV